MSDIKTLGGYPNLAALLDGACGPISQWPGVPVEVRAVLEENEWLRSTTVDADWAHEEIKQGLEWKARIDAALAILRGPTTPRCPTEVLVNLAIKTLRGEK